MQRRRQPTPHIFEKNLATEKAKLEAQIAKLKPGPERDALRIGGLAGNRLGMALGRHHPT
jgi:hypothetical protein